MTEAERLAIIKRDFNTSHCVHDFDAGWLIERVERLTKELEGAALGSSR